MSSLIADLADSRSCGKPNLRLAAMWVVAVGISILLWMAAGAADAQTLTTLCSFTRTNGQWT